MPPPDSFPPDPGETPSPRPEDNPPDAPGDTPTTPDDSPPDRPPGELTGYIRQFLKDDPERPERRKLLFAHTYERLRILASQMLSGYRRLRREVETGDILHQTYLKIEAALERRAITDSGHLVAYAATAMRHELIDLARRFRRRSGTADGLDQVPGDDKDPSELAQITEMHEQVGALPDYLRQTVELVLYQGLTHAEAATVLDCDPKTVARWYAQALALLEFGMRRGGK